MIRISITEQGKAPREVTFEKTQVTLGRAPTNDLSLDGPGVSGSHCRLTRTAHGVQIEDLGSTNGTYVNRRRVGQPQLVTSSDEIILAVYQIVVHDAQAPVTTHGAGGHTGAMPVSNPSVPPPARVQPTAPPRQHTSALPAPTGAYPATHVTGGVTSSHLAVEEKLTEAAIVWRREWEQIDKLARAWVESGRDRSRLLRGAKLTHARQWLARGRGKLPQPKPEHRAFIGAATRASQLRIFGAVSLGGLVLGAAVVVAVFVRRSASGDEENTTSEPDVASATAGVQEVDERPVGDRGASDAAAQQAAAALEADPELALLLAIEGLRRLPVEGGELPRASHAEQVFRSAAAKLRSRPLRDHEGP